MGEGGRQIVASVAVDGTAYCVYKTTEQLVYHLLIKLMISQTRKVFSNCNNGNTFD